MDIESLRKDIDKIDGQILELFLERLNCCEKIADLKLKSKLPVLNKKREMEVLEKISSKSGKYNEECKKLFSEIISISKELQHKKVQN